MIPDALVADFLKVPGCHLGDWCRYFKNGKTAYLDLG